MPTPFDYDRDPERFRLASRVTREHLTGAPSIYARIAGLLADAGALPFAAGVFAAAVAVNVLDHLADPVVALREVHRVLAAGGLLVAATASRHDSPELGHVWRPPPASFDAEDGPGLVASVFGRVEVERWDAPLVRLPGPGAVRDYLVARFLVPERAAAAAGQVATPLAVTKRGALIQARREGGPLPSPA